MNARLAWRVEEACLNAWPCLRQIVFDGWLLRFADGRSRRTNSVNPLMRGERDLAEKIQVCESYYRGQDLPAIFRVTSVLDFGLDGALEQRGYTLEGRSLVRYAALDRAIPATGDAELDSRPSPEWLAALGRCQEQTEAQLASYVRTVEAMACPAIFAAIREQGEIVSVAYGGLHDGLVCVNSVATSAEHRRRGFARHTVSAILGWARAEGAEGGCLQVEANNTPAIALYYGLGFTSELYRYHYRRQPPA